MNNFIKVVGWFFVFIVIAASLAYPFGQIYKSISGPSAAIVTSTTLYTIVGFVYSLIFGIIFCFNFLKRKVRFIWMLLLLSLPLWFVLTDRFNLLWFPISIIISAFALSELTKYLLRKYRKPQAAK